MVRFASRAEAGRRLGRVLADRKLKADLAVGLPRGGVVVAAEVARILKISMDVLVVRKIGHPRHREFAAGALAEGGVTVWDAGALLENPAARPELDAVIAEEAKRLQDQQVRFHPGPRHPLTGLRVLILDDGLATGATMEVAVRSVLSQNVAHVTVAAPVASASACARLEHVADEVVVLVRDENFSAVGCYYLDFAQMTDAEVLALLRGWQLD
jgi:predicted phosphoribosyltransferase